MTSPSDKSVRVSLDSTGLPIATPDPVEVKKDREKIRWTADFEFRIVVEDYDDIKCSSSGGTFECKSGVFHEVRPHKYSIIANGRENDPMIDIKPDEEPPPPPPTGD